MCTFYYQTEQFVYRGISFLRPADRMALFPYEQHLARTIFSCVIWSAFIASMESFQITSIARRINLVRTMLKSVLVNKKRVKFAQSSLSEAAHTRASLFWNAIQGIPTACWEVKQTSNRSFLFTTCPWPACRWQTATKHPSGNLRFSH